MTTINRSLTSLAYRLLGFMEQGVEVEITSPALEVEIERILAG
jgi:hypothetical protein